MKMSRLSLVAVIALGALMACANVNAQEKEGKKGKGPPSVEQQLEKMTKELSLTDEQQPKVKAALEDNRKKTREAMSDASGDRQKMREKRKEISDELDKKLKEILKSDQFEKWEKMRDKMREEMRKGGKRGGAEGEKKQN